MLGAQQLWAGARVFRGGAEGGVVVLGGQVCDVVVTPCDVRRLEMEPLAQIDALLLLYLG